MRKDRGSALLELAIIVPVLLTLVLAGTDLLFAVMAQSRVNSVAQTSATCVATPGCKVQIEAARNATALGLNPTFLTVSAQGKVVKVVYVFHLLGPLFPWPRFTVSATSS